MLQGQGLRTSLRMSSHSVSECVRGIDNKLSHLVIQASNMKTQEKDWKKDQSRTCSGICFVGELFVYD